MNKIIQNEKILMETIENLKASGKTIVFTNGCFNLLHVGHIRSLKDAKNLGDVLIVGVNDDKSIEYLKRDKYPLIIPVEERMEILAALSMVDYVIRFSELSADNLLLKIRPQIYAKGTDYTKDSVPERDTVLSYGGEIEIVGDPKEHSVTELFNILGRQKGA
ncbi:MAG: adenylyltransferase/cytidyltransferase family protein [Thermodesulfobacteriota bacterium]|nr:adenylyltransferase/cytidyltransferase family protein [Thermodesulfobacteriota bacterium]